MTKVVTSIKKGIQAGWRMAKEHVQNHKREYAVSMTWMLVSAIAAPFWGPLGMGLSNFVMFMGAGIYSLYVSQKNGTRPSYSRKKAPLADSLACAALVPLVVSALTIATNVGWGTSVSDTNKEAACIAAKELLDPQNTSSQSSAVIAGKYDNYDNRVLSRWRYPHDREIQMSVHPELGNVISRDSLLDGQDPYRLDHEAGVACVTLTREGKAQTGVFARFPDGTYFVPVSIKKAPAPQ